MSPLLPVIGVAALLFATTNVDDLFVLVAFFADPAFRPRQVVLGQLLGIGTLVAISLVGSLLALVAPAEYIGLLGILPFGMGALGLARMLRGSGGEAGEAGEAGGAGEGAAPAGGHRRVVAVALVTIANGGDNIGAYVPVFATRTPAELAATVLVFLLMTAVWCLVAHALVAHPRLGPVIRRVGAPLTPFVLMGIGVLIVVESGAYQLVGRVV